MSDSTSESVQRPFRILSLDGGGIKGLYSATLLKLLVKQFTNSQKEADQFDLGSQFDLICGTSIGAIIGIALAKGISLSSIVEIYRDYGPKIFPHPMPDGDMNKLI